MTNIVEELKNLYKKKILRVAQEPSNIEYIIDENVPAAGKQFNLKKLLGGAIPNVIQIYSSQNFNLRYTTTDGAPDKVWPRTLALGIWHNWLDEGWTKIYIDPVLAADIDGYISGNHKR